MSYHLLPYFPRANRTKAYKNQLKLEKSETHFMHLGIPIVWQRLRSCFCMIALFFQALAEPAHIAHNAPTCSKKAKRIKRCKKAQRLGMECFLFNVNSCTRVSTRINYPNYLGLEDLQGLSLGGQWSDEFRLELV